MSNWRYVRYVWLLLFSAAETLAIVAMVVNPVHIIGLLVGAAFCVFMIYGVLSNWEDVKEK